MHTYTHSKNTPEYIVKNQAERVGFEPTVPCGTRALQARALGQTTLPLHIKNCKTAAKL